MVKGSIKLVIQSDARQAEKDLQALEKSAQRIKDLEKENAALGKSYDQMRAKAEKAAQATLEAASKAAAAGSVICCNAASFLAISVVMQPSRCAWRSM